MGTVEDARLEFAREAAGRLDASQDWSVFAPTWVHTPSYDCSLTVLKGDKKVGFLDVGGKTHYLFGKAESCDLRMAHGSISRHHAMLCHHKTKGVFIIDLKSSHGTFVGRSGTFLGGRERARITPHEPTRLLDGSIIMFGESTRTYVVSRSMMQTEDHDPLVAFNTEMNADLILQDSDDRGVKRPAEASGDSDAPARKKPKTGQSVRFTAPHDDATQSQLSLSTSALANINRRKKELLRKKEMLRKQAALRRSHQLVYRPPASATVPTAPKEDSTTNSVPRHAGSDGGLYGDMPGQSGAVWGNAREQHLKGSDDGTTRKHVATESPANNTTKVTGLSADVAARPVEEKPVEEELSDDMFA